MLLAAAAFLGLLNFVKAEPFWIVQAGHLQTTRLDPIVSPGAISGHLHTIVGGSNFGSTYDYNTSRSSQCTTANLDNDLSNYWIPALYRKTSEGLALVKHSGSNVYYLMRRTGQEPVYEFPPGFRMLAGDASRTTYTKGDRAQDAISYTCLGVSGPETNKFPKQSCPGGLRAQVFFPHCWDGVNAWLPGSKHVSYGVEGEYNGGGKCPDTHPKRIMSLFYEFFFDDDVPYEAGARVWANGDTTGNALHGDFTNGWPEGFFQEIFDYGEECNVQFSLEKCPALAKRMKQQGSCIPQGLEVAEDFGIDHSLDKLPGNNPVYGVGGSTRDQTTCTETAKLKPVGLTLPQNWENLGCIADPENGRALTGSKQDITDATPEKCLKICADGGFKLAGLQFGKECYCGNELAGGIAEKATEGAQCDAECPGAGGLKGYCGGGKTNTVYKYNGSGNPVVVAGDAGSVDLTPTENVAVKAGVIRKDLVKGDPNYPAGKEIITLDAGSVAPGPTASSGSGSGTDGSSTTTLLSSTTSAQSTSTAAVTSGGGNVLIPVSQSSTTTTTSRASQSTNGNGTICPRSRSSKRELEDKATIRGLKARIQVLQDQNKRMKGYDYSSLKKRRSA